MPAPPTSLVVWITGAAGGIGSAVARVFAASGARLVLHTGRRPRPPADTPGVRPDRSYVYAADVRSPSAHDDALSEALARFGRIDVCVANAGIWPPQDTPLKDMDPARVQEVLDVNLAGALWTARAFLRVLADTGPRPDGLGASLCFVGSTAGRFGEPFHAAYAASKGGLRALVPTLAREIVELDPRGRVNMVEPGWTATAMARPGLADDGAIRHALSTMPLARVATAGDIAQAIAYLCDPVRARHVTGEVVTVAGGMQGRLVRPPEGVDPDAVRAAIDRDEGV